MPSPFPGMDPYLEHPAIWPDVHQTLITHAREHLLAQLGESYHVAIGQRVYIEAPQRSLYPDVSIVDTRPLAATRRGSRTAVLEPADQPKVLVLDPVERREPYLEIRHARQGNRVLTVIEVLSPTNKWAGSPGRELYLRKQEEVLASRAHLVEIDLLREGELTVAAPIQLVGPDPYYRVVVSRAEDRSLRDLYAFGLKERLPRVGIPIEPGHPDIVLDLPALIALVYEKGAFSRIIDYKEESFPPLQGEVLAWARKHVSERPL